MHDYVRGAFEALSWISSLLEDPKVEKEKIRQEVEEALDDIKEGSAVNFRFKLREH